VSRRRKSSKVFVPEQGVVRDVTAEGNGVVGGGAVKTVFVDGALTGEEIVFQRRKEKRRYDEANLLEVLKPSPHRVTPKCAYFLNCGGCTWQHLDSEQQILIKQETLLQAFARLGGVRPAVVMSPLRGKPWGYRRRARFAARYVDGKQRMLVGFRERLKPFVADMASCETVDPVLSELLPKLQQLIGSMELVRQIPQVEASVGEAETSLVFRVLAEPSADDMAKLAAFAAAESVTVLLQRKGPDTITQLSSEAVPENLFFTIPDFDIRIEFGPVDFIQVNHEINLQMIQQAVDWLQPQATDRVLDLFCGLGNFSLPLARRVAWVTGVEGEVRSVEGARANAERNAIENAEFFAGDLFDTELQAAWMQEPYDIVLLDPPRAGAAEIMPVLKRINATKLLYVSCHPGTLARDSKTLVEELGYKLVQAGVIDMFPQTGHVESMALFEKII
jgi:23S rRNA (uracil1939-C5)-methyltransferase